MPLTSYWKETMLLSCILFSISCRDNNTSESSPIKTKKSSFVPINEVLRWKSILKNVGEPDLTESKKESYRFCYGGFQGHDIFMFTVIVDSVCTLSSKFILDSASRYKSDSRSKELVLSKDSSIKSYRQILTFTQINQIRALLDGTYYYSIGVICPKGDGWIRDDMGHIFEFRTACCGSDSLSYHQIHFPNLTKGQFSEIWNYILSISTLTVGDKRLQKYLMKV